MIQEVDIIQLDPRLIKQLEGADRAESSDVGYTMEIYSSILKQYPDLFGAPKKTSLSTTQTSGKWR